MKVTKSVSFDTETDKRLLAEVKRMPRGEFSATVRKALLAHFGLESGVSLGMVYARLADIERKLDSGAIVARSEHPAPSGGDALDPDILSAFDT